MHTTVFITALRGLLQEASLLLVFEQRGKTLRVVLYDVYDDVTSYNMARLSYAGTHWKRRRCVLVWTGTFLKRYDNHVIFHVIFQFWHVLIIILEISTWSFTTKCHPSPTTFLPIYVISLPEFSVSIKHKSKLTADCCVFGCLRVKRPFSNISGAVRMASRYCIKNRSTSNFTSNTHTSYCHDNIYKTNVEA